MIARGRIHILDSLGLALAGADTPPGRITREHVIALGVGDKSAALFGTGHRTAPRFAAMCNGTSIHADNFDDTNPQADPTRNGGIHATAAVLPAVLALGEAGGSSGREVSAAYHVGVEIACRLSHAVDQRHYADGFHTTGTLNAFGCAAACARLTGLDSGGIADALALAASQAAGVRLNFGSMVEPTHTGHAAECGVVAADLAARGLGGAADALEGPSGYIQAAAGGYDASVIDGRLGAPWAFDDPGMWIKPHPSGALTHPAMGLMAGLLAEHDPKADSIKRIWVRTNARIFNILTHHRPTSGLQGKFSMEFGLAILALERRAGLAEFTDEAVGRADVREMIDRVDFGAYETPEPDYTNVTTLLDIELADGKVISGRADHARGSTRAPMSYEDVTEKFLGCASYANWPDHKAMGVVETVAHFEELDKIGELTELLTVRHEA